MCGIFGCVALAGREPSINDRDAVRLRDMLAHRGPDAAGLWRKGNALLAHTRLSVVDPSDAGAQPMATPDGRFVIVYNGELYNDAELREELESRGVRFKSACDTETVLHAFATWGTDALDRMRGMYALAFYDSQQQLLTLARDPLGVKPLYFWTDAREIVFASEPRPILNHPLVSAEPNAAMISAYLTTIRTVLGNNTLFQGVYALRPGETARCDFAGRAVIVQLDERAQPAPVGEDTTIEEASRALRDALADSVHAHMRADVPACALLSGGIDSTITALLAKQRAADLRTYCAAAPPAEGEEGDLSFARCAAEALGTNHTEAIVTRESFAAEWPRMVRAMGVPLSTPNEVAIHAVASRLRADGCVVTISGEGADELLAGYEGPMESAWRFAMSPPEGYSPGRFQLESNAWIPVAAKETILKPEVCAAVQNDEGLVGLYDDVFALCEQEVGERASPLDAHLRFHRRVNLTGLLQRLDTATMLAGVEGRTPFADARVARLCEALPMRVKYAPEDDSPGGEGVAVATRVRTKMALRAAFEGDIPQQILERPKASFPLPFQEWVADRADALRGSNFARQIFTDDAIATVAQEPARCWRLAWPMINIAIWGDAWWGSAKGG